jgi:hypothetical protein
MSSSDSNSSLKRNTNTAKEALPNSQKKYKEYQENNIEESSEEKLANFLNYLSSIGNEHNNNLIERKDNTE